jgi:hypothetical protein
MVIPCGPLVSWRLAANLGVSRGRMPGWQLGRVRPARPGGRWFAMADIRRDDAQVHRICGMASPGSTWAVGRRTMD